jgi:hypothetical protein
MGAYGRKMFPEQWAAKYGTDGGPCPVHGNDESAKQLTDEREKVKLLVDALERLQTTRASEHQAIIADALAKVKEGK